MANTITKTTVIDGVRNVVIIVDILGDGSGEQTNTNIFTRASFAPTTGTETVIERISGNCNGFTASIIFDATTKLQVAQLPATWFDFEYACFGGVSSNKAGAGAVGDILLSTQGLGANERGTFYIEMKKS